MFYLNIIYQDVFYRNYFFTIYVKVIRRKRLLVVQAFFIYFWYIWQNANGSAVISPCLWFPGVTTESFKSEGNIDFSIHRSMFSWKYLANTSDFFPRIFSGTSFCCVFFAVCRFLILLFFVKNVIGSISLPFLKILWAWRSDSF